MEASSPSRNYRAIIREIVEARAAQKDGMSFTKLASVCRMQRSYLSQVMNLRNHFSNDQLYAVCEALGLPKSRRDFLMLLSEYERCKNPERRAFLQQKIQSLEAADSQTSSGLSEAERDALDDYFCDPMAEVVLNFFRLEHYARNPQEVREVLGITARRWQEVMKTLRDCQFIVEGSDRILTPKGFPVPEAGSPADRIRHIMARMRVTQQKLKQRYIDDFLYNLWYTTSHDAKKQIKINQLHLFKRIYEEARTTRQEKIYQLTLDVLSF
jgi:transcriptional regulator with XRE-family HTH domain